MRQLGTHSWITAGVALVGVGAIAVAPTSVPPPDIHLVDIQLTVGATDITLDLVRHGQSVDNVEGILGTVPPGAALTDVGKEQAIVVGDTLYNHGHNDIAGVYASELLRTQQTAWPLDHLLLGTGDPTSIPDGPLPLLDPGQILAGLNELNAGFLEGQPLNTFTEIAYILAPIMWISGQYWVPQLGSDIDPNGVAFNDRVTDAIQAIYDNTISTTSNDDGKLTDVVFSHAGTIAVWTLMNVKNPDFGVVLKELLDTHNPVANTGQVVLEGNPTDGWTLISWDGTDVPQTPDLLTGLFVDWRDLITAPQIAGWHIWEAIQGGDQAAISAAFETGFQQVVAAITQFPQAVIDTITGAFGDGAGGAGAVAADASLSLSDLLAI